MTRLSRHFTLDEYLASFAAERHVQIAAQQRQPPDAVVTALTYLNQYVQSARDAIGWPIHVNSGWRCEALNRLIGGSPTSQHVLGEAGDLSMSNPETFLSSAETSLARRRIERAFSEATTEPWPKHASANFYLWSVFATDLERFDVDQLIHEYGEWGRPAWVHVSASTRQSRRRLTVIGDATLQRYQHFDSLRDLVAFMEAGGSA